MYAAWRVYGRWRMGTVDAKRYSLKPIKCRGKHPAYQLQCQYFDFWSDSELLAGNVLQITLFRYGDQAKRRSNTVLPLQGWDEINDSERTDLWITATNYVNQRKWSSVPVIAKAKEKENMMRGFWILSAGSLDPYLQRAAAPETTTARGYLQLLGRSHIRQTVENQKENRI